MTVTIEASCTACGACLVTCPTGALVAAPRRPAVWAPACIDCLACIEVCPVDAIRWGGVRAGDGGGGPDRGGWTPWRGPEGEP